MIVKCSVIGRDLYIFAMACLWRGETVTEDYAGRVLMLTVRHWMASMPLMVLT